MPEDVANKIYDDMISFASYAFNKSHAAAYAYLSYQTAYLKRYYTVEFIAAVLNNRITKIDEIRNYLSYLKERGIAVLPPNINKSFIEFTVEDGAVRIGMAAIKNVGAAIIGEIVAEREKNGPFTEFHEFVERMSHVTLNKKMLESLIYAGTFDCFGHPRAQLMQVYEQVLDRVAADKKVKDSGQFSFFDTPGLEVKDEFVYPDVREYPLAEKLRMEKEVSRRVPDRAPARRVHLAAQNVRSQYLHVPPRVGRDGRRRGRPAGAEGRRRRHRRRHAHRGRPPNSPSRTRSWASASWRICTAPSISSLRAISSTPSRSTGSRTRSSPSRAACASTTWAVRSGWTRWNRGARRTSGRT